MAGRLILIGASGALGATALNAARRAGLLAVATYGSRPFAGGVRFRAEADRLRELGLTAGDAVILFAAHSDQEWVRTNAEAARALNVVATLKLAEEARSAGAKFVFLSSEAVFGADRADGWPESAAPCPSTEYGRQKVEVEAALLAMGHACVVRTGWNVTDSLTDRCVVRNTRDSLLAGGTRLAEDNVFSLTHASDTAGVLLAAALHGTSGIVHAVSGVPITRTALADAIIQNSAQGRCMNYKRIRYSELTFKEPRPRAAWLGLTDLRLHPVGGFLLPLAVVTRKVALLEGEGNR